MKKLFIVLLSSTLLSFTDINIKGFNVNLDECNKLHVSSTIGKNELIKEIKIINQNNKNIYLYRKVEHLPLNFWVYLPEGTYKVETNILLKNGKNIKDVKKFKINKHE